MQGRAWGFRPPAPRRLERSLVPGRGVVDYLLVCSLMGQRTRPPLNSVNASLSSLSPLHNLTVSCS